MRVKGAARPEDTSLQRLTRSWTPNRSPVLTILPLSTTSPTTPLTRHFPASTLKLVPEASPAVTDRRPANAPPTETPERSRLSYQMRSSVSLSSHLLAVLILILFTFPVTPRAPSDPLDHPSSSYLLSLAASHHAHWHFPVSTLNLMCNKALPRRNAVRRTDPR